MKIFRLFKIRRKGQLERKGIAAKKQRSQAAPDNSRRRIIASGVVPVLTILMMWATCAFCTIYQRAHGGFQYVRNQLAPENIYADVSFDYIDSYETERKQKRAADNELDIYRMDTPVNDNTEQNLLELVKEIETRPARIVTEAESANGEITLATIIAAIGQEEIDLLKAIFESESRREYFLRSLRQIIAEGIVTQVVKSRYTEELAFSPKIKIFDEQLRDPVDFTGLWTPATAAGELLKRFKKQFPVAASERPEAKVADVMALLIIPNLVYDRRHTEAAKQQAMNGVQPIRKLVRKGTPFLRKGETVTQADLEKLSAYDTALKANRNSTRYLPKTGSMLVRAGFVIVLGALLFFYLCPRICRRKSNILLVGVAISVNLLLVRGSEELLLVLLQGARIFVLPALPIAFAAILLAILIGTGPALIAGVVLSLLVSLPASDPMHVFMVGFAASCLGAYGVRTARTRIRTFRAGLAIGLAVFVIECLHLVLYATPSINYLIVLGIAAANGFVTVLIANLLLPLCEYLFGLTSDISVFELSDLNHPLLKRLQLEAPGTYHHTLMVATLAEHAADVTGANTIFTRVASYFHDIGKLSNPSYFTENSFGVDRHEDLTPRMSSLIILNHVKEGLTMAAKYKLKKPLREVIASHHGTSLIYSFYHRAMTGDQKSGGANGMGEDDYRYPGPLPKGREAAIISLADACEAASRSLEKPTPQKINSLVSEIFRNKILDGQLDECDLTMREVGLVEKAIKKNLSTMLHGRVAYPKTAKNESHFIQAIPEVPVKEPEPDAARHSGDVTAKPAEPAVATDR